MKKYKFLSLVLIILLTACSGAKPKYNGSRIRGEDLYVLIYDKFNSTESHSLKLEKDDVIKVEIVDTEGKIDIEVKNIENDNVIYRANDAQSADFELIITEDGEYEFVVTGDSAEGSVKFEKTSE